MRSFPLSYGQRALWFLQRLAPGSAAYNGMCALRVRSELDLGALARAFQALVDRHPSLRTTYRLREGRPEQVVHDRAELSFRAVDAGDTAGWSPGALAARVAEEAHAPFDLERGPLVRVTVHSVAPEEHALLLALHHIAVDFRSMGILLDELCALYPAMRRGLEPDLPPPAASFEDYVAWQLETVGGAEGERQAGYWRRRLAGGLPPLELATDRPRPPVQTFRGGLVRLALSSDTAARVAALAAGSGATPFDVLLAAFQALLHRASGQERVVVGSPFLARGRPEFEGVVGYFVNPVVLPADFPPGLSFRSLLAATAADAAAARAHQDWPFPLLVERLQPARDPSRSPLFQALFVLYREAESGVLPLLAGEPGALAEPIDLGGLAVEAFPLEQRVAMLDLALTLVETGEDGGALSAALQYNADLFDAATAERLAGGYRDLLEAALADPDVPVAALPAGYPARAIRSAGTRASGEEGAQLSEPEGRVCEHRPQPDLSDPLRPGGMEFGLFYFAADEREGGAPGLAGDGKYRLLLEGARFADRHGFSAVWTPERHFHPFGGLYPNPTVTGAALAAVTERVAIRAGSLVLPLHHPVRVAEDWSVIDNLSRGRVGIAFASGWHADDFVLSPADYEDRKRVLFARIEAVRRLWRGEAVPFPGGAGEVAVRIYPRPVQAELPVWVTTFGSPGTFRMAGEIGASVLTHLLGQTVELLGEKIAAYREAFRARHDGEGHVTLMLHTFVGEDLEAVRETVRGPFSGYLRTCADLLWGLAQAQGLGLDPAKVTEADFDALVAHAFDRYFATSGLFGTPESCLPLVAKLAAAGVDEVACLIDFGVEAGAVLDGLRWLDRLRELSREAAAPERPISAPGISGRPAAEAGRERALTRRELTRRRLRR